MTKIILSILKNEIIAFNYHIKTNTNVVIWVSINSSLFSSGLSQVCQMSMMLAFTKMFFLLIKCQWIVKSAVSTNISMVVRKKQPNCHVIISKLYRA